jgi:hypothetical protein
VKLTPVGVRPNGAGHEPPQMIAERISLNVVNEKSVCAGIREQKPLDPNRR